MMKTPRRLPVIGRLAWAWLVFAGVGAGFVAYSLFGGEDAHRIALPVAEIERMARPLPRQSEETLVAALPPAPQLRSGEREARPVLVDPFADTLDQPGFAGDRDDAGSIVITIDGADTADPSRPLRPALVAAPRIPDARPGLLLSTPYGERPKRGADGRRAAREYARPFDAEPDLPLVGLIVGGLGINPALTERAIAELPGEVTLAFAPYAKDLARWTEKARMAGHEILIELPMEPHGGDPAALGPAALTTARSAAENLQRLDWLLSRFGAYVGATNYLGGRFSADRAAMAPVLARLDEAGLVYFDDTGAVGGAQRGPATFIDRVIAPGARRAALADLGALEAVAKREGDAIGKAYVAAETIDAIAEWASGLAARGLALAPASTVHEARSGR